MGKRTHASDVIDFIISYIVDGGVLTSASLLPVLGQHLNKPVQNYLDKTGRKPEITRILRYMRQNGLIDFVEQPNGGRKLRLTKRGRERSHKINLDHLSIPRPKVWDQKWRIVLFDIPEKHKTARDALTSKLRDLGFFQMQRSVWIHPFPCLVEIAFLKQVYGVNPHVTLAEVDNIDKHGLLLRHFRSLLAK